jgi:hypothetical protein
LKCYTLTENSILCLSTSRLQLRILKWDSIYRTSTHWSKLMACKQFTGVYVLLTKSMSQVSYICFHMSFLIKSYQEYCYVVTIGFDSMLPGHSLYSYQWVVEGWWCKLWFCIAFPFFIGYCFFQYSQIMLFLRRCQAIFDCVVTRPFVSFSFMYPNAIQVLL